MLRKRQELELDILGIHCQLKEGTERLEILRQEEEILHQHERLIEANQNFMYKTKRYEVNKTNLPVGIHTTTCLKCTRTCHANCTYANNNDKHKCSAMTNRYCRVCPLKCSWDVHKNLPYRFDLVEIEKNGTYEELKSKYLQAKDDAGQKLSVVDKIKTASNELRLENLKLVNQVRKSISELQKIALRANPLSEIQYIELLIQTELDEKKIGFEDRINVLEEMKREAIALQNITKNTFKFPGEE